MVRQINKKTDIVHTVAAEYYGGAIASRFVGNQNCVSFRIDSQKFIRSSNVHFSYIEKIVLVCLLKNSFAISF